MYHILYYGFLPLDSDYLNFSTPMSLPQDFPGSFTLQIIPFSSVSSLVSSTRSSEHLTVRISCPILKFPKPSRTSLVRCSLWQLKRIRDKQLPCLTYLPEFSFHDSLLASRSLIHWYMYSFWSIYFRSSRYNFPLRSTLIRSSLHGQTPCAIPWSTHTFLHVCSKFVLILFLSSQLYRAFLFFFYIQTDVFQIHPQFPFQLFFTIF